MDQELKVTRAADIEPRERIVTLKWLRTRSGEPVSVLLEAFNDLALLDATRVLPGHQPPDPNKPADKPPSDEDARAYTREMMRVAPGLLENGTAFLGDDGALLRPAFYAGAVKPHPYAIPFRSLRVEDVDAMVNGLLELGHYGGEPAAGGSFSDGGAGGDDAGAGTGGSRADDEREPAGGAAP